MSGLLKRRHEEDAPAEPAKAVDVFDRMFDDWMSMWPFRRPAALLGRWMPDDMIKVDEFHENGTLVVRAELPGIDPDEDVELTVTDGVLRIAAERREDETTEEKGYVRRELRYGSFTRSLDIPEGVSEADITAAYKDGVLEVRIPAPEPEPGRKIPITKA